MRFKGLALFAVVSAVVAGCGDQSSDGGGADDVLRVGQLAEISGPLAPIGTAMRDTVQAVVDDINARGGVNGREIELSVYDTKSDPTTCATGATQLARQDEVVAIVGSASGSCTLAAAPVAAGAKVPVLSPNATISVTSEDNDFFPWVFRATSNDLVNTKAAFEAAVDGGAKRIAIFHQEDAFGQDTAAYLKQLADENPGVEVVAVASASLSATDVTAEATTLRNAGPDAVFVQTSPPPLGAAFIRGAQQVGLDARLYGGVGMAQTTFLELAGPAANGLTVAALANPSDLQPGMQELEALMPEGSDFNALAAVISSNAILTAAAAAKELSGEVTGETLREALEDLCGVKLYGPGDICYSASNHDGLGDTGVMLLQVENGQFVSVDSKGGGG